MKVTFIGAAHEVTGSCTLLEACGKRILIDCGMEQGADLYENCDIPVAPDQLDAICLTHAHIDHSGKIPALVAHGFDAPIYATDATRKLCDVMLRDSAHIQEAEAEWRNRKAKRSGGEPYVPLYVTADVERTMPMFRSCSYGSEVELCEGIKILFTDDGHLLGSSNILFTIEEDGVSKSILFSGDVGNNNKPLIRNPQTPPHADYVVIESTYGDRVHPADPDYVGQLSAILEKTFKRKGTVIIPAFAVGRTQELLYHLRVIKEKALVPSLPDFPVYVDSPMASAATNIYSTDVEAYYDEEAKALIDRGINPIQLPDLNLAVSVDESKAINMDLSPKVIISASGMCEAGRIRHHLKHGLWRPENTVVFVGYQSPGTLGGKLLEGVEDITLFGEPITVQAEIATVDGCSSHADRNMLMDWLRQTEPGRVFVNHGEDDVAAGFAEYIHSELGVTASAPFSGEVYDLVSGECVEKAPIVPVIRKKAVQSSDKHPAKSEGGRKAKSIYQQLEAAGRRLMAVISRNQGGSNKELSRFVEEINNLCDKYDR